MDQARRAAEKSAAQLAVAVRKSRKESDASLFMSEPIAIVGIGCRFPGDISSPRDYWRLLENGVDAITEVPPERWDSKAYFDSDSQAPGKTNGRWGGFIGDVDRFDPVLFGISPREAVSIDPQQRLLLEVAWEALWDSGHGPESLGGSRTGVFIGICGSDYERILFANASTIGPQACSGIYHSVASGRISYLLNLRGPSVAIDTACSSSLVAVHNACLSLRTGECNAALAGGVNLHLLPEHYIGLAKLGMLSSDGRCKTFDAAANGFVPSEGCGLIVLKRLADALRDGDGIYAVIRGTAVNQDGRTNVLTAPNGLAQQDVVRSALQNGHVEPASVSFIETHGTGTVLGDPIEVEALTAVLGMDVPGAPKCFLGAVKSNLGHLEAAAGIAGLIKVALALEQETIPPNLHFATLNSNIMLEGTRFQIPQKSMPWPRAEGPRFGGVSSFGFGGTNSHVVLEEAPKPPTAVPAAESPMDHFLLPLSARTPQSLEDYAKRYQTFFGEVKTKRSALYEICHSAATRRDHYEERLAIVAGTEADFRGRLAEFTASRRHQTSRRRGSDGVVFICSGQGSQWPQMGMRLFKQQATFKQAIEECHSLISEFAGWSLIDHLSAAESSSQLHHTEYAQPAIFAIEVALGRLWQSWGIFPVAIIGHSAGEVAAAHIAGILDLKEAIRIVVHRGKLMQASTGLGKMAAIHLPVAALTESIRRFGSQVSIACVNSPTQTVLSGDPAAVEQLIREWLQKGVGCRELPVNYAFHSEQMQSFSEVLTKILGTVNAKRSEIPMLSTVLGTAVKGPELNAAYWGKNIRQTVLFSTAIDVAKNMGLQTFVEIGPHPVLLHCVGECLGDAAQDARLLASMDAKQHEMASMLSSLGELYLGGCAIAWHSVYPHAAPAIKLPTYPYERQRYWVETRSTERPSVKAARSLIGIRLDSPGLRGSAFETELSLSAFPYLADHRIGGLLFFPMAAFLEMMSGAVTESGQQNRALLDVILTDPLIVKEEESVRVQITIENDSIKVFSRDGQAWKLHASARLADLSHSGSHASAEWKVTGAAIELGEFYSRLFEQGADFGPSFHTLESLHVNGGTAIGRIRIRDRDKQNAADYLTHPALLDGCLQTAVAAAPKFFLDLCLPFGIDRFEVFGPAGNRVQCVARIRAASENTETFTADADVFTDQNQLVAHMEGLHFRSRGASASPSRLIHRLEWDPAPLSGRTEPSHDVWLVECSDPTRGSELMASLRSRGLKAEAYESSGTLPPSEKVSGVIVLATMEPTDDPVAAQSRGVKRVLSITQEVLKRFPSSPPQLWLITQGAVAVAANEDCDGFAQAPIWGFGRTLSMEHPELHCTRCDLDPAQPELMPLVDEILAACGTDEIAWRRGQRYISRLEVLTPASSDLQRLAVRDRGSIDRLMSERMERNCPASGELEIAVEAAGLNFRDVLNVLGMYPGDPGPLGLEFCGRVARIGEGVTGFSAGDRVMGLGWGSFVNYVNTPAALVVRAPEGLSCVEVATLPNAFLTARYCLAEIGKLSAGRRVLIHAATGGVGLAAVQVAQQCGAEIFATAGSEEREATFVLLEYATSSARTLDFAQQILDATDGTGVDLILNSLAGDFIEAGFTALANGGHFIEIGRTGIWGQEKVQSLGRAIRYSVVDLGMIMKSDPGEIESQLALIARDIEAGCLRPLPVKVWESAEASEAFRYMAQAKHIGKIVLRYQESLQIYEGASYLITGGLGTLGLHSAEWLASQRARWLVLMSRHAPSPEAMQKIEALRRIGVHVAIFQCDVSRREKLAEVLELIQKDFPPIRGIIHAAGTLDDGVIRQQDWRRFENVMAPKVAGAWNLHELTQELSLDFFLLYSSMAALTGSPGQSGYAAANAFLDGLSQYRKARGQKSLSINWGVWANGGMAERVKSQGRRRVLPGLRPMPSTDCFSALEMASRIGIPEVAIADFDWSQWEKIPHMLRRLARKMPTADIPGTRNEILRVLQAAPLANRRKLVIGYLRQQAVRILGLSENHFIDEQHSLLRLGLDSLMAVEFRNDLALALRQPLSATLLFDYPSIGAIADHLGYASPAPQGLTADPLLASIDHLSDAEAEAILREEIGQN